MSTSDRCTPLRRNVTPKSTACRSLAGARRDRRSLHRAAPEAHAVAALGAIDAVEGLVAKRPEHLADPRLRVRLRAPYRDPALAHGLGKRQAIVEDGFDE
jgi:hypothetical protein